MSRERGRARREREDAARAQAISDANTRLVVALENLAEVDRLRRTHAFGVPGFAADISESIEKIERAAARLHPARRARTEDPQRAAARDDPRGEADR